WRKASRSTESSRRSLGRSISCGAPRRVGRRSRGRSNRSARGRGTSRTASRSKGCCSAREKASRPGTSETGCSRRSRRSASSASGTSPERTSWTSTGLSSDSTPRRERAEAPRPHRPRERGRPDLQCPPVEPVRRVPRERPSRRGRGGRCARGRRVRVAAPPERHPPSRRRDLVDFHESRVGAEGLILAVTGDVDRELVEEAIAGPLSRLESDAEGIPAIPPPPPHKPRRATIPMPHKSQADIAIGGPAVPRGHPDYYALNLANLLFGRIGLYGRLGRNLRDEQGLAY